MLNFKIFKTMGLLLQIRQSNIITIFKGLIATVLIFQRGFYVKATDRHLDKKSTSRMNKINTLEHIIIQREESTSRGKILTLHGKNISDFVKNC